MPQSPLHGGPPPFTGHRKNTTSIEIPLRQLAAPRVRGPVRAFVQNRRSEIRRAVRLDCRVRRVGQMDLIANCMLDLSAEGMLVLSNQPIAIGTELAVSFFATSVPIWFDTRATVTRVIEGRRPSDAGRALGLRFRSLPPVSRLILRGHLKEFPLVSPRRERRSEVPVEPSADYAQIVKDIYDGR